MRALPLPGAVGGAVAADLVGGGVDVGDPRVLLVGGEQNIFLWGLDFPAGRVAFILCHGILRDLADVSGLSQVIEALRAPLLVERVSPDGLPQRSEVSAQRP